MIIRMAKERDVPDMLEIYRPYIEQTAITFEYEVPTQVEFLARFRDITSRLPWLVCEEDGEIFGYAYADRAFARAAYSWVVDFSVYLRMDTRGRGTGRCFYALLERMVAQQGYQMIYGLVTSDNESSCRFHEKTGYHQTAVLKNCGYKLGRWHDVFWYEKRICAPCTPERMPTPSLEMDWSTMPVSDLNGDYTLQLR